ncbi:hypothetical protein BJF90_37915 [Pseudonocardia sp. CNS-004]|nr:hypothetical protein BJF90_37915 [Pseudonocardia sp. CNS-004]
MWQVAQHALGSRVARLLRQAPGLAGHGGHELVAFARQLPQRRAVEGALRVGEPGGEAQQAFELCGAVAGEQVRQPCGLGGPAQPADGLRQLAVAAFPRRRDGGVAGADELVGRHAVQRVGGLVEPGLGFETGLVVGGLVLGGVVRHTSEPNVARLPARRSA